MSWTEVPLWNKRRAAVFGDVLALLFFLFGRFVVYLDAGSRLECPQDFVAASHDLVTGSKTVLHFDVRGSRYACLYRNELRGLAADHEHALDFFFIFGRWLRHRVGLGVFRFFL